MRLLSSTPEQNGLAVTIQYRLIRSADLDAALVEAWVAIQEAQPRFDNPYFRPEFAQAVGAVRDDVEIAVIEEDGRAVGFFPFQRDGASGRPAGGKVSDFQGVIARSEVDWNPADLLRACRLRAWNFDHLLAEDEKLSSFHDVVADSCYLDLSHGFEHYESERRRAGTEEIRQALRKARRIEREVGPLRLEYHSEDSQLWAKLKEWKGIQYAESDLCNVLEVEWVDALLKRISQSQTPGFTGALSALYAGDNLIAVHFGMRSHGVFHWWFPAYNREHSRNSPGALLMLKFAQECELHGIKRLDLGKGPEQYKRGWGSGAIRVAEGCVEGDGLHRSIRANWVRARQWLRASPYMRAPARWLRPLRSWWALR